MSAAADTVRVQFVGETMPAGLASNAARVLRTTLEDLAGQQA